MTESTPRPILHDINLSPYVRTVRVALAYVDAERWPGFAAYVERIHKLPCYAPIVAGDMPPR